MKLRSYLNKISPKVTLSTVIFLIIIISGLLYLFMYNFGPAPESYPEEISVGAILPLSGNMKTYGIGIKQGIEMAVEEINKDGGIRGKPLVVDYFDNLESSNLAVYAFKKFAENNVPVVIGPVSSSTALALAPLAEEYEIVLISPTATNPGLSNYHNYVFRTISSDIYQGKGIAKVLPTMNPDVKTAAVLYINTDYGKGLRDSFVEWFPEAGGEVVLSESYEPEKENYYAIIDQILVKKPDAVVLIGTVESAKIILKNADEKKLKTIWFCSEGLINEEIPAYVGIYSEGMCALMQSSQIQSDEFVNMYMEKYNTTGIDWPVPYGYDTMKVVSESLRASDYNGKSISESLKEIRYVGLCGPKVFDEKGDIPPAYDIMRIENGKWVRVRWNQVVFDYDDK